MEPFGGPRDDLRAALQVIAALAPWQKKRSVGLKPSEVFPDSLGDGRGKKPDTRTVWAKIMAWAKGAAKAAGEKAT
jgi:hypothetical protein